MNALKKLPQLLVTKRLANALIKQQYLSQVYPSLRLPLRSLSTSQIHWQNVEQNTIIKDTETPHGETSKHEFKAETKMLLEIVAKSLYSENEVFIRELISNASDALEKLKYHRLSGDSQVPQDGPLEIHIATDKLSNTFTIQDTGIGLTKEELISSLGTIARSGSKAFLEQLQKSGASLNASSIIGQFGVGFYSAFMVASKVEVYSLPAKPGSKAHRWVSDGSGTFEVSEAEGVQPGTKIILHLKPDCKHFADEEKIKEIVRKYSNFVGSPIFLNGTQINKIQALWLKDPKEVTLEQHTEFYRFITGGYDSPRYTLHYSTDAPINIRALLYVPASKPGFLDLTRDTESGINLYSRRILIRNRAENILPKWLRFVRGVVDSEDIPLNLSRELLQNSALIRKIRTVLTNRLLRHLNDQIRKDPASYDDFMADYGVFLKEGILSSHEQMEKEEIGKLLRFESSLLPPGQKIGLAEYVGKMKEQQNDIYYLAAPSRALAETSPYFEAVRAKDVEVLFCYEAYDELVLIHLNQFNKKNLISVEKEMRREKEKATLDDLGEGSISKEEAQSLLDWIQSTLGPKVHKVSFTKRLDQHPCLVSVEEMGAARHFVRTQLQSLSEDQRYKILEPTFEVNLSHPIIKKLSQIKNSDAHLAELLVHQLFDNAMVVAGLVDDPRKVTTRLTDLLTALLQKH